MVTFDDRSSSSKQRRIRSLLHYGHKPLTFTGPYCFLSLSNRGPSRQSDGTSSIIRSSLMTSQVEVELPPSLSPRSSAAQNSTGSLILAASSTDTPGVDDGSPGSREAEGEGGEGFYIAQSGRSPIYL
jgi:hypothetical protein